MKRSHRTYHKAIWLLTAGSMAAILWAANAYRPAVPLNAALPITTDQGDL